MERLLCMYESVPVISPVSFKCSKSNVYCKKSSDFVRLTCHECILVTISWVKWTIYQKNNKPINFEGKILWIFIGNQGWNYAYLSQMTPWIYLTKQNFDCLKWF